MGRLIYREALPWCMRYENTVRFDVFPNHQSPFHQYIKTDRMFSFAQLHSVYHGAGEYQIWFTDAVMVSADEDEQVALERPRIPETFQSTTLFDHILAGLGIQYLAHADIPLQAYDVVGDQHVYHADSEQHSIQIGGMRLRAPDTSTVIEPEALRTDHDGYADTLRKRLQHLKTYFQGVMESANLGVSHKHYIKYLLDAFPGRIQVHQLPAMYTEFEPLYRQARSLDDSDVDAWDELAVQAKETEQELEREMSFDEKRFLCTVFIKSERFIEQAANIMQETPNSFADNAPRLIMRLVDTMQIKNGDVQIYNSLQGDPTRELHDAEAAMLDSMRGDYGDH